VLGEDMHELATRIETNAAAAFALP
jgi:hypothetical protein